MLPTESGNDWECLPPSCRDKGWTWRRVGALCLSWWLDDGSGFREANRSHPHEDKHKAQYISNRDKRRSLGQQFGALGSHHHDHKILKALPRCKGLGRRDIALLGFVFFVDLLDLSAIDAQVPLGQQVASQALQQALSAPAL